MEEKEAQLRQFERSVEKQQLPVFFDGSVHNTSKSIFLSFSV